MHGIAIESQLSKHAAIGLVQDSALSSSEFVCVCVCLCVCVRSYVRLVRAHARVHGEGGFLS